MQLPRVAPERTRCRRSSKLMLAQERYHPDAERSGAAKSGLAVWNAAAEAHEIFASPGQADHLAMSRATRLTPGIDLFFNLLALGSGSLGNIDLVAQRRDAALKEPQGGAPVPCSYPEQHQESPIRGRHLLTSVILLEQLLFVIQLQNIPQARPPGSDRLPDHPQKRGKARKA